MKYGNFKPIIYAQYLRSPYALMHTHATKLFTRHALVNYSGLNNV